MTVTLLTSQSTPTATEADALVIGVFQGADGPVPAWSTDDIDLTAALTALGAAGKLEEITKVLTDGRLAIPVVVAVGLGPDPRIPAEPGALRPYSSIQPSPILLLMRRLSFGLLTTMKRRGVTPFVTLVNFSGIHS